MNLRFRLHGFSAFSAMMLAGAMATASAEELVLDVLTLEADTNALVNVESGDVLTIEKINGSRGTVTKTGGGALRIKLNRNRNARFDVKEGTLYFDREVPAVCGKAAFHVDPSRAETLEIETVNGTNFVVRWNDVRGNGMFATNALYSETWRHDPQNRRAFISEVAQNGLPVVDFGSLLLPAYTNELGQAKGYGAAMAWSETLTNVREVYEVISDTPDVATIAGDNLSLTNYMTSAFISTSLKTRYCRSELKANGRYPNVFEDISANTGWMKGRVYLDGALTEPTTQGKYGKGSVGAGFHVLGFTTRLEVNSEGNIDIDYAATVNAFARDYDYAFGGQRIGEYLVFTNRLSDTERATLQEYLVEKWDGNVPPYVISSLTVAPEAKVVFAPRVSAVVANIADGSDLALEKGTLELNALKNPDAYFHVDADAASTMVLEEQNGTNFVTRWNDAFGGSIYAEPSTTTFSTWLPDPGNRRPFISEEKLGGRAVVDFGALQVASHTNETGYGIGYGAAMKWSARMPERAWELITVARDTEDVKTLYGSGNVVEGELGQSFICDPDGGRCYRGNLKNGNFPNVSQNSSQNAAIKNGVSCIDGVSIDYRAYSVPTGFHVINLQLGSGIGGNEVDYSPCPGWFSYSKYKTSKFALGGTKIAEYLVFPVALTNSVREDIYTALRTKWFGEAKSVQKFGNLSVGTGAKLVLPWKDVSVTNCLTALGGELEVAKIGAKTLSLQSPSKITGELTLEDSATVTVSHLGDMAFASIEAQKLVLAGGGKVVLSDDSGTRFQSTKVPIVKGGYFVRGDGAWTLDATAIKGAARLSIEKNGIYVDISPLGMSIIVR